MNKNKISVIGNPNCGKTTLFNALTGSRQKVGNWSGVTVDKKTGHFDLNGQEVTLVDLPGVYSVSPSDFTSEDERIARDYIQNHPSQLILNIVDASNIERNLYLTMQLLEMKVPVILVVNMLDIAKKRKIVIDLDLLQKNLSCPVVGISAVKEEGLDALYQSITQMLEKPRLSNKKVSYPDAVESSVQRIISKAQVTPALALQFLEEDLNEPSALAIPHQTFLQKEQAGLSAELGDDVDIFIADSRYRYITQLIEKVVNRKDAVSDTMTDKLDRIALSRILGVPIFLVMMYLMFLFAINVGSAFIDFFDILFGGLFVDGLAHLMETLGSPDWVTAIVANGIGGGIQTVSTFIPVIFCLYLFMSLLEDSGYMARAAFVMDRLMRTIGLPGKAFVPLIVGFGCNVPGIMATRTIENRSDRITTVMMAPFMSCGARLPVYVLFATAFYPKNGQNLVFSLYVIGILAAIFTGFILKRTALKGETSRFIMELPPYHLPTFSGIMLRTWSRLKDFILRAGKMIVIVVAVLATLNTLGTDGTMGHDDTQDSVLSKIGQTIVPVFKPMGIEEDNWPAAVGIFTGIFAKEAVVGTLDSLYTGMADAQNAQLEAPDEGEAAEEEAFNLMDAVNEAFASVPANLADLGGAFSDPLGISVDDLSDKEAAAESQEITLSSIDMVTTLFDGKLGAFAYLIMILLYVPCVAAVGAIWREVGRKWTLVASVWTTGLGYSCAVLVYQIGTFTAHPAYSAICIACVLIAFGAFLRYLSGSEKRGPVTSIPVSV